MRDAERGAPHRRAAGVDRRRRDRAAGRRRAGADRRGAAPGGRRRAARAHGRGGARAGARRSRGSAPRARRSTLLEPRPPRARRCACARSLGALGDAEGRRHGRGDDGQQRARAGLHGAVRADPGRRRTTARWPRWSRRSSSSPCPARRVQVAVAREIALGRLGEGPQLAATLAAWRRRLLVGGRGGHGGAVLLREPIARPDLGAGGVGGGARRRRPACCGCCCRSSAARCRACTPTSRWRGRSCWRPAGGSCFGLVARGRSGMGVTGAYLGTPLSLLATAFGLWWISAGARLGAPAPGAPARRLLRSRRRGVARGRRAVPGRACCRTST